MAPDYRHVETGRVIGVREDSVVARLVEADAGYELIPANTWRMVGDQGDAFETYIPDGDNERAQGILTETLARLADTERQLADAQARLADETVAVTDPPSPIGEDGIPVLTDPEQTEGEPVEQTAPVKEVTPDAGNTAGRGEAPRTRARRRGDDKG